MLAGSKANQINDNSARNNWLLEAAAAQERQGLDVRENIELSPSVEAVF